MERYEDAQKELTSLHRWLKSINGSAAESLMEGLEDLLLLHLLEVPRSFIAGPDMLKTKVIGALRWLQKSPHIVKAFFNHSEVLYTAG